MMAKTGMLSFDVPHPHTVSTVLPSVASRRIAERGQPRLASGKSFIVQRHPREVRVCSSRVIEAEENLRWHGKGGRD